MNQNRYANVMNSTGEGQGGQETYRADGYRADPSYYPTSQASYSTPQAVYQPQTVAYAPAPRQSQSYPNFNAPDSNLYSSVTPQAVQMSYDSPSYPRQTAVQPSEFGYASSSLQTTTLQHNLSASSTGGYQQSSADQGHLQSDYGSGSQMAGVSQIHLDLSQAGEQFLHVPAMETAYASYQTKLKQIFQDIVDGKLLVGAQSLLQISEWLLGHVGELVDQTSLHADRIRLWGEFNTAWQALFVRQMDLIMESQVARNDPKLMNVEFIEKMAKNLIAMNDKIEKHGLVDYQMGVEEEKIFEVLMECLKEMGEEA
ncbi:hypothetical protein BJ878DRAFT_538859 [Calycina marina]|uniref:Uncharacterized protein n=1 Tax=Calycina marina TaxID=1763456 RepID=A0A9P7Z9S8_9HELO|nr:hypothetical protein BJ878DRAFT_538859 [Calycina marina]